MIWLRDPLRLRGSTIAVPRSLGPLLGLMDGTRDEAALEASLWVRTGARLAPGLLSRLLADLDAACLLDSETFWAARAKALDDYRAAPFRPMNVGTLGLPLDADGAAARLQQYIDALDPAPNVPDPGSVRGIVSPHIDYDRGGPVYAQVWRAAAEAARQADLVILFGTDHSGADPTLTLTSQSYATPWGTLPTDLGVVEGLKDVLGPEAAFGEELHHRGEHSIELAAVWLHFIRGGAPVSLVPILCGSFAGFLAGEGDPGSYPAFQFGLELLREVMSQRRTLVVAAADLAHMGPTFGDRHGLDAIGQAQLRQADNRLLSAVDAGDAAGFFEQIRAEEDRRHVCGVPPIYLMLRLLDGAHGEPAGYALCPADPQGASFVSIAGGILR